MLDIDDDDRELLREMIMVEILEKLEITMTNPSEPGATPCIALTYDGEVISSI